METIRISDSDGTARNEKKNKQQQVGQMAPNPHTTIVTHANIFVFFFCRCWSCFYYIILLCTSFISLMALNFYLFLDIHIFAYMAPKSPAAKVCATSGESGADALVLPRHLVSVVFELCYLYIWWFMSSA
jgi:hypothetical protein